MLCKKVMLSNFLYPCQNFTTEFISLPARHLNWKIQSWLVECYLYTHHNESCSLAWSELFFQHSWPIQAKVGNKIWKGKKNTNHAIIYNIHVIHNILISLISTLVGNAEKNAMESEFSRQFLSAINYICIHDFLIYKKVTF